MEYLAVKTQLGRMYCQSRKEREIGIDYCIIHGLQIGTIVEKTFENKNDAEKYCDKINNVNNLINEI